MIGPTPRQLEVLRFIARHIQIAGYPPTLKEIGKAFRISSTNGVNDHLQALERKGLIARTDMVSRGIVITDDGKRWASSDEQRPPRSTSAEPKYVTVTLPARCSGCLAVTFAPARPCFACRASARQPQPSQYQCSRCGEFGHNARTCSSPQAAHPLAEVGS